MLYFYTYTNMHWKHIKVDQKQQLRIPFESSFLVYIESSLKYEHLDVVK